jgi:hypothetical protein
MWKSHLLLEGIGEVEGMMLSVVAWRGKTNTILHFDIPAMMRKICRLVLLTEEYE